MKTICTLEEFMDVVMTISDKKAEWNVKEFMFTLSNMIVKAVRNKQSVSSEVTTAWFHLYSLLGTTASRERIRATALGVKDWLKSN